MTEPKTPSLFAKLASVMAEIGYVEKRGWNDFHKYKYVTEADLIDAVRAKLAARNVVVLPSLSGIDERAVTNAKGKASTVTTARIAFTFCDGDSGETHTAEWAGCGDDPADKGLYKAMTGAEKYFLMKAFLIPTGDDPEADAGTDERSAGGQSSAPKVTAPAPVKASTVPVGAASAAVLFDQAEAAKVLGNLQNAAAHVAQREVGDCSTRENAIASLSKLTADEAMAVDNWIARKVAEAAA